MVNPEFTTVSQLPAPNSVVMPPFSHARILARHSAGIQKIEFVTWRFEGSATRVWLQKTGSQLVGGVTWEVWEGDVSSPQTVATDYTGYFDIYSNDGFRREYSFMYTIGSAVMPIDWLLLGIIGLFGAGVVVVYYVLKKKKR